MREIEGTTIVQVIAQLSQEANFALGNDVLAVFKQAEQTEKSPLGREVLSRLSDGRQGIIDLIVRTVDEAGGNPSPQLIIGLGIGATGEKAMLLAKKALLRKVAEPNPDPETAELEKEILTQVNALGIGPLGFGGTTTALAMHAEVMPTHIASLPVAVNLQCHSARHQEAVL